MIAHIRKATQGKITLENSHPFIRELWGRHWIFAHNGDLHDFDPPLSGRFTPVGNTDSERAFCYLLDQLVEVFGYEEPSLEQIFEVLEKFLRKLQNMAPLISVYLMVKLYLVMQLLNCIG